MKILAIRIRNLASLEGSTEIDFTKEPLLSTGIFAITGSTGAGKSTVLDALCLALYARTPRYAQAKEIGIELQDASGTRISQGDVRSILRDGTAEGSAEVDFTGTDGKVYRSTWQVRRARNKATGSLQQDSLSLMNLTDAVPVHGKKPELLKSIQQLAGLSFEQFTRSVLLAQGDFTAFLKAPKDEKAALLEKLTGTEIYSEISKTVYENAKMAAQELRDLIFQKENIPLLPAPERTLLETALSEEEKEIQDFRERKRVWEEAWNWYRRSQELEKMLDQAGQAREEARAALERLTDNRLEAEQVAALQPVRSLADRQEHLKKDQQVKSAERKKEEIHCLQLEGEEKDCLGKWETVCRAYEEKEAAWDRAVPLLLQARALDVRIQEKSHLLLSLRKEKGESDSEVRGLKTAMEKIRQDLDDGSRQMAGLERWLADHRERQGIADNTESILSALMQATEWKSRLQKIELELAAQEAGLNHNQERTGELQEQLRDKEERAKACRESWEILEEALMPLSVSALEEEKGRIESALERLTATWTQWKMYRHVQQDMHQLSVRVDARKKDLLRAEADVGNSIKELAVWKIKKDTAGDLLEKARVRYAGDVALLRNSLAPGQPCPVCGSQEHPFAAHPPGDGSVLIALEEEWKMIDERYEQQLSELARQKEVHENIKRDLVRLEEDLSVKTAEGNTLLQQEHLLAMDGAIAVLPGEERAARLEEIIRELKREQETLREKTRIYHREKIASAEKKSELDNLLQECTTVASEIKHIVQDSAHLQETLSRLQKDRQWCIKHLEDNLDAVSGWFTDRSWMANWQQDPGMFSEKLRAFSQKWQETESRLAQLRDQEQGHGIRLAEQEKQFGILTENLRRKVQQYGDTEKLLQETEHQRNIVLGGKEADVYERELKTAREKAGSDRDAVLRKTAEIKVQRTASQARMDAIGKSMDMIQQELERHTADLSAWLEQYNNTHAIPMDADRLRYLLSLSHEHVERNVAVLKELEGKVMEARSVYEERRKQLQEHKEKEHTELPEERMISELERINGLLEEKLRSAAEARYRLAKDREYREQSEHLQKKAEEKEQLATRWGKLNEVIGSADGKKFRQSVQEYTLDVLLSFANHHLQGLSGRYRLGRIPGTLGLMVTDKDMGDETRTVFSLSGGESFLISLALALGLASLSSDRINVESLFIDEGFGALDPDTLHTAIDALERLHNQGKKVGIISHVREMTERIPVQIAVNRLSNGKSAVVIKGNMGYGK